MLLRTRESQIDSLFCNLKLFQGILYVYKKLYKLRDGLNFYRYYRVKNNTIIR